MADAWKNFEAISAALFGEKRCWANSGQRLDFPDKSDTYAVYGQCKNVKVLSINELTHLAEEVADFADVNGPKSKLGVVCVKIRRGRGQPSKPLVVMTFDQFEKFRDNSEIMEAIRKRKKGEGVA